jgi:creatinine amidohydrolase
MLSEKVLLQELSWPEVRDLQAAKPVIIIPTGAIEQHGPHLPLEVDSRIAEKLAEAAARKVRPNFPILVTPVVSVGASGEHMSFPGTLSLSTDAFMVVARQILGCLIQHGFDHFFFLNGHGGNEEALKLVARTVREEHEVIITASSYWQLAREEIRSVRESPGGGMNHGGEEETSLMLFLRPDLVNMAVAEANPLRWRSSYLAGNYAQDPPVAFGRKRSDIAPMGHNGDPTLASSEKGRRLFDAIVEAVAHFVKEFHKWRLDQMTSAGQEQP